MLLLLLCVIVWRDQWFDRLGCLSTLSAQTCVVNGGIRFSAFTILSGGNYRLDVHGRAVTEDSIQNWCSDHMVAEDLAHISRTMPSLMRSSSGPSLSSGRRPVLGGNRCDSPLADPLCLPDRPCSHVWNLSLPLWVPSPNEILRYRDRKHSKFRWERDFASWYSYPSPITKWPNYAVKSSC